MHFARNCPKIPLVKAKEKRMPADKAYLDIVKRILVEGELKHNRTGTDTIAIAGAMFQHDMKNGFPLLTTKKVPFRLIASELEFFLKGMTDKKWLIDRNNHIWDEWCNPEALPSGATKDDQKAEMDLGPIYGYQWRRFNQPYKRDQDSLPTDPATDQIRSVVDKLHNNPDDRRMIVSAWNPVQLHQMALPPCHVMHQVTIINGRVNLLWYQRSCDFFLGVPFNIASYALLLHLYAKEAGLKEGVLTGFFADAHIYANHRVQMEEQLKREPRALPSIETANWKGILDWSYEDTKIVGYDPHPAIKGEVAV